MLLEIAIGDAYGAGFEYVSHKVVRESNNLTSYIQHPRHTSIKPGFYTDDTQMSVALAEHILKKDAQWTHLAIAESFLEAFKRDPREGYAKRFYGFLTQTESAKEFLTNIRPDSNKSGAAMRSGVVGLYPDINEVIEKSTLQAEVTHNTQLGVEASVVASLMVHYFKYNLGTKSGITQYISDVYKCNWVKPWKGKVGSLGIESVAAAITAIKSTNSLSALLIECIGYTGDVDTVAAIAMGPASLSSEFASDIPETLYKSLENGLYGRKYIEDLDIKLSKKFPDIY
jgi:ADP-ribosylglycohydrolase